MSRDDPDIFYAELQEIVVAFYRYKNQTSPVFRNWVFLNEKAERRMVNGLKLLI